MNKIRCSVCGEEFTSYGGDECDYCRVLVKEEQFNAQTGGETCLQCGAPVPPGRKKYCSRECCRQYNNAKGSRMRVCKICGLPLSGAKRVYCSPACRRDSRLLPRSRLQRANFTDYEKAFAEAEKRGVHLSYGEYAARRYAEQAKKIIGANENDEKILQQMWDMS